MKGARDGDGRPNVVVVVLDSVRHDRTSLGGHDRDTTPELERIASRPSGASFDTAIAHARYTLPSSASLLTGTYPWRHDVGFGRQTLASSVPTVAEAFRDSGYSTALVSNNDFVSPETNLARGFESFRWLPNSLRGLADAVGLPTLAKWGCNLRRHSAGFETDKYRHSTAYLMDALVRKQLDAFDADDEPFFLYAHFNQPHRPYYPPIEWFERYGDAFDMSTQEAGDFSMDVHRNLVEKVAEGCPFTEDEWAVLRALYDAQIEYTDGFVGDLFKRIQRRFGDTVFVVTGDHGEHFGERGALGHKYVLDDSLLRVPLVTDGLDIQSTSDPVQHTDVMRTLLEVAGARSEFVDGVDLRHETRSFAVSEDVERSLDPIYDANPDFDAETFLPGAERTLPARTSLRTDSHRYVRGDDGTEVLFELPDETRDVSSDQPGLVRDLRDELDAWESTRQVDAAGFEDAEDAGLAESTKSRLENMGYLEEEL